MNDNRLHLDGQRLRSYIDDLEKQSTQWRTMFNHLGEHIAELRKHWQDRQFEEFQRHVRGTSEILGKRIEMIEKEKIELYELARLKDILDNVQI